MDSRGPRTSHRYRIEWTSRSAIKQVTLVDTTTGRHYVGADWADWDKAWSQALHQAIHPSSR